MTDPLRRLKYLPWRSLLQVSGLTILIVIILVLMLAMGYTQSLSLQRTLSILHQPPLDIVMVLAAAMGVGALAVYFLERFHRQVFINSATLWALVPCLALVLFLKSLLPVPELLVQLDYLPLMGIIVGIFWKGRPYWQ
jgi:uncharacterized membrane protein